MAGFARRSLGDALLTQRDVPVLIVEGARAVGKTTMMQRQIVPGSDYSFYSLLDSSTYQFASQDTEAWLRQLPRPAVIDEAQLLPNLPLAMKDFVDTLGAGNHFILTGSASIGRTGLGGADPLARRSRRLTMNPLTSWEINGQPGSIVDALFTGEPIVGRRPQLPDESLLRDMQVGGFPSFVYPSATQTRGQLRDRVRSDIESVLSDEVLPGAGFDALIARGALDSLLRTPGGIFNASRLAQSLDLDRRTVDRYLGIFQRLFLVHWLPNLATAASRQGHSRSKVHPVDVSFSVESLTRAGVNILQAREAFGSLLESHVVNQVVAASQWSRVPTDAYFWRHASNTNPEVDLVLVASNGETVGVEVKASSRVEPRDFNGLRALDQARGLHRGFVFYTGDEIIRYSDRMWAIPVQALSDSSAFGGAWGIPDPDDDEVIMNSSTTGVQTSTSFDATLFLSYVHADDEQARGRIVQFARDLVDTYSFLYGHQLQLFVDRDDILWGENWATRLRTEVEATSFLLSIVTPRYLTSEACRTEVLNFASAAKEAQDPRLLLPLQWVDVTETDVVAPNDPVRVQLAESQYIDVTEIRRIRAGTVEYDDLLEKVAARLRKTIETRLRGELAGREIGAVVATQDEPDLMTIMQGLEESRDDLEDAVEGFKQSFEAMGAVFRESPQPRAAGTYATANALAQIGRNLNEPVALLRNATQSLGEVWQRYDSGLSRIARVLAESPESETRTVMFESLDALARSLDLPGSELMEQQLSLMGNISRHLKPMSQAVSSALKLLKGIQESARSWRDRF